MKQPHNGRRTALVSCYLPSILAISAFFTALPSHAQVAVPTLPHPEFAAALNFEAGRQVTSIATADFNGDGILDVATANLGIIMPDAGVLSFGKIVILFGNGDGTFRTVHECPVPGALPRAVAAGDFNGDGRADFAVAVEDGNKVSVSLGNGDGSFQDALFSFPIDGPVTLTIGDFDRNGWDDVVAGRRDNGVSILLSFGDGTLLPPQPISEHGPLVAAGDINADGILDLAAGGPNNADIEVLLGDGSGAFTAVKGGASLAAPTALTARDLNGDKRLDLAAPNGVALGKGDGTFERPIPLDLGPFADSIAAEDFDGDGRVDLVVGDQVRGEIVLLNGGGDGSFVETTRYLAGFFPLDLEVADFDADGSADLAVGNNGLGARGNVSILRGRKEGGFRAAPSVNADLNPEGILAADFNGDGKIDLAAGNAIGSENDRVSVILGNGNGTFGKPSSVVVGEGPRDLAAADFNGDGRLDLAVTVEAKNSVTILTGRGDGTFEVGGSFETGQRPVAVAAADFTNDGKPDLAVANSVSNDVVFLINEGNGGFRSTGRVFTGAVAISVTTGDFNADGRIDAAVSNLHSDDLSVLLNNGDGSFAAPVTYEAGHRPISIAAVDLDRNGTVDLAVANSVDSTVTILPGRGDGTFGARTAYPSGNTPVALAVEDLNGDGIPDLAVTSYDGLEVLLGGGERGFERTQRYAVGRQPRSVAAGDFDGDGRMDLAAGQIFSVAILLNEGAPFVPGDVDGDGKVAVADTLLALRIATGAQAPDDRQKRAADFDGSGSIDLRDVTMILRRAVSG